LRYCLILLFLGPINVFGQDWSRLGHGFQYPNNLVWSVEPHRNELYMVGTMFYDGQGNEIRGFAKWDGFNFIPYAGQMPKVARSFSVFRYRDSLFISTYLGGNNDEYFLAYYDETNHKLDTVTNKVLYGPVASTLQKNDTLYLSGLFEQCGGESTWGFCMYDGYGWHSLFSQARPSGSSENFYSFTWYKGKLYVGGNFYLLDENNNYVEDVGILENGQISQFGGGIGFTGIGFTSALAVFKDELYIAGYFISANGLPVSHIVKWDGDQFSDVGGGADYYITDMLVYKDNLYICGPFSYVGGVYSPGIARWDGANWHRFTEDSFYPESAVQCMKIYKNELYISGNFLMIEGDTVQCVAKYNHQLPGDENSLNLFMENVSEQIIINFEDPGTYNLEVNVYAINGQQVKRFFFEGLQGYIHKELDMQGVANGVYIVDAVALNEQITRKIIKFHQ
jgi:hypothetical protein